MLRSLGTVVVVLIFALQGCSSPNRTADFVSANISKEVTRKVAVFPVRDLRPDAEAPVFRKSVWISTIYEIDRTIPEILTENLRERGWDAVAVEDEGISSAFSEADWIAILQAQQSGDPISFPDASTVPELGFEGLVLIPFALDATPNSIVFGTHVRSTAAAYLIDVKSRTLLWASSHRGNAQDHRINFWVGVAGDSAIKNTLLNEIAETFPHAL